MKTYTKAIFFLLLIGLDCQGQINSCSILEKLSNFLISRGELEKADIENGIGGLLFIREVNNGKLLSCKDKVSLNEGLYRFGVHSSHSLIYAFLFKKNKVFFIDTNAPPETSLNKLFVHLEQDIGSFNYGDKLIFYEEIISIYQANHKSNQDINWK